jgi:integrase
MAKRSSSASLTAASIKAAPLRASRYDVTDGTGLILRVETSGRKTLRYRVRALDRVITLGPWSETPRPGFLTLKEAQRRLLDIKESMEGAATREEREARLNAKLAEFDPKPPAPAPGSGAAGPTVREVAAAFKAYLERKRRRPEQGWRPMDKDILPAIGDRPIASVTPAECRAIVEAVVKRGSPVQAGIVLGVMKQFFGFALSRDEVASNPVARFSDPQALGVEKNISQRYLSPEEIRAFWLGLDSYKGMTVTVRNGLKLLLLLGVRSGELLQAKWEEVDTDAATWTVPVAHQKLTKSRERIARPWTVPLGPTSLKLLGDLRALADAAGSAYVMASFHPTSEGAAITEKALNHAMRRMFEGDEPVLRFDGERPTPHDLRRTMRTHLGDTLGVPWHVAERCLNHAIGTITATYDVGDYVDERRAALEKWDAYVARVVAGEAGKVVKLSAVRA